MISRSLDQWLTIQQSVHPRGIDLELSRVSAVARRLGILPPRCPVITVAGTNGKGSVVAFAESLLIHHSRTAGVFTSPHLIRYNERIRIGGVECSDAELISAFERIELARAEITLTYFEYNALAALLIFADRAVDVMVLEVGLGGRLDATNIVDADVAVVCSIGFDHRDWLGDTLEDIGREKAGIFRRERVAILGTEVMPASIFSAIQSSGAFPRIAGRDFDWSIGVQSWSYLASNGSLTGLPVPALAGSIQYRNAATAIAAVQALPGDLKLQTELVAKALRTVKLPGRFQVVSRPVEWIVDVAHNEPAAQVLARHLEERPCSGRTIAVVGILVDKDVEAIGAVLEPVVDEWILCSLQDARGQTAAALATRLLQKSSGVNLADSVVEGCAAAARLAQPGDRIVAFGSFLVAGAVLEWLGLY